MKSMVAIRAQPGAASKWLGLVMAGLVILPSTRGGHPYHPPTFNGYYHGHYHRPLVSGPYLNPYSYYPSFSYQRPYGFTYSRFFPGYTYAFPRFFSYPVNPPWSRYGYYHPGFVPYRTYPENEPRIFVYPQHRSAYTPRRILVYSPSDPILSEITPDHTPPPVPDDAALEVPPEPPPLEPERAWEFLDAGLYPKAMAAFSAMAIEHPQQGIHKLGFGLAAALAGDTISASHGFRRAFATDPDGSSQAPISQTLKVKIRHLILTYERRLHRSLDDLNLWFLQGALRHLLGEEEAALASLEKAQTLGDTTESTVKLMNAAQGKLPARPPPLP